MARRTTWLIDMGDGTWAVSCMACRIALYRGAKAGADRAARRPLLRTRRSLSAAGAGRPEHVALLGPGAAARSRTRRGRTRRPPPTHNPS